MTLAKDRAHKLMQEFYLSPSYDPKAERPADVVQAAIEFALSTDRAPADVEGLVEQGVQAALDGGYAVNGEHGVAAARVSARHVAAVLQAKVSRLSEAMLHTQAMLETIVRSHSTNFAEVHERIIANRAALTEPPSKYGHGSAGPENNEG